METPRKPTEEENWAGPGGKRWLGSAERLEASMKPVGEALLALARLVPGERVIEIGCGAGGLCCDIAARVAPGGSVIGLDISPNLVQEASRRAQAAPPGCDVRFVQADAGRSGLPAASADCLVSRFGSMFFSDPYGAFAHLRTLLRSGGRMALACWAPLIGNPWMLEMRSVIAAHFELPVLPPRTPGPFAYDDPEYLRDILVKAGFQRIETTPWEGGLPVGGPGADPASAADFLLKSMSVGKYALEAPEPVQRQIREEVRVKLEAYMTPHGVSMPASVWMTRAAV